MYLIMVIGFLNVWLVGCFVGLLTSCKFLTSSGSKLSRVEFYLVKVEFYFYSFIKCREETN